MQASPTHQPAALYANVLATVSQHFQVSVPAILGSRRTPLEVAARQVACAVLASLGERPASIGRRLHRDHSTVVHSLKTVARKPDLAQKRATILAALPPTAFLRIPTLTLSQALDALLGAAPPEDAQAVRRFLGADILGLGARPDQAISRVHGAYYLAQDEPLCRDICLVIRHFIGQSAAQALASYTARLRAPSPVWPH
ncbi:MAG TPA: helix-turn-helix domain-containing protein [Chloroflexota bacterium]|nr:helix-turn-helix domain-containing protein [Chloroflexota bacterium]